MTPGVFPISESTRSTANSRLIIVDDNVAIHEDYRKIFQPAKVEDNFDSAKNQFFLGGDKAALDATSQASSESVEFDIDSAYQGAEALEMVIQAKKEGRPYAMAFVDMRMPPGWDGVTTIKKLWEVDDRLQIVICTAYSDHSWEDITNELKNSDQLLILKKPFDRVEVLQMAHSLTRKWQLAVEAARTTEQLNTMVQSRTRELERAKSELEQSNEELILAKQVADTANLAKSQFLANMSHDIRTPLTAILGFAEELCCEEEYNLETESRQQAIQAVVRNGGYLVNLINDILDVSKIEAKKLYLEHVDFSLVEMMHDVVSLLNKQATDRGLTLQIEFDGPLPETVRTDPVRLRQILLNLLGNGMKFTDEGSITLRARLVTDLKGAPLIGFEVEDTGVGVPQSQISKIFEPFEQATVSTTRTHGGTGLGLTICRQLAILLGGQLEVESQPGVGSVFRFAIDPGPVDSTRMLDGEAIREIPSRASLPKEITETPNAIEGRLLIVDDGVDNRRLISLILSKLGADVQVAENGQQGFEVAMQAHAKGKPFDTILMDLQMPLLNGDEATRRLRAEGYLAPIVMVTANAMVTDHDRCIEAGCDDFLTKPIDRKQLTSRVTAHIARWRLSEESHSSS